VTTVNNGLAIFGSSAVVAANSSVGAVVGCTNDGTFGGTTIVDIAAAAAVAAAACSSWATMSAHEPVNGQ